MTSERFDAVERVIGGLVFEPSKSKKWPVEKFPRTIEVFQVSATDSVNGKKIRRSCSQPFNLNIERAAQKTPQLLRFANEGSLAFANVWLYEGKAYVAEDKDLTANDVRALVNQGKNKRRLALEKAHALQAMTDQIDKPNKRERITQATKVAVWQRDKGRCVECESQQKLEFDHVIPVSMGGANTERNLQLLCETCNRRKGASLG